MNESKSGAVAATASVTGYSGAAIILITYIASLAKLQVPGEVSAALVMLLTPLVHFVAMKIGASADAPAPPPATPTPAPTPQGA